MALINSLIASVPKSLDPLPLPPPGTNRYASSTNKTPPLAASITFLVLVAVCPINPSTKSLRCTSMNCPVSNNPTSAIIRAVNRAIVVLPVPGLPIKHMCSLEALSILKPNSFLLISKSN